MASPMATVPPATDRPPTTRAAPVTTGLGSPPSSGTEYRCVHPRSRTQNTTVRPSPTSCGEPPGYAGAPGITLRSSAAARSTGSPPSSGSRSRRVWPIGLSRFPATTSAVPSGVHAIAPADAVVEPDRLRSRAVSRVDDVDRRAEGEVGVGRRRRGERQPRPVRRPRGVAGVPVAVGQLAAVPRLEVDDVQVLAHPRRKPAPSAW